MLCAVFGCNSSNYKGKKNKTNKNIRFLAFPKDPKICKQWVVFCGRMDHFNTTSSKICSYHFTTDDYKSNAFLEQYGLPVVKRLKPNVVPSVRPSTIQQKPAGDRRLAKRRAISQTCSSLSTTPYQQSFSIQAAHSLAFSSSTSLPQSQFELEV